jgi:hypothetical protein
VTITSATNQLSTRQKYPSSTKVVIWSNVSSKPGTQLGSLTWQSTSAGNVATYAGSVSLSAEGTYWYEVQPTAAIANHYYCSTASTSQTGSASRWLQMKTLFALGSDSSSWTTFSGTPYQYPLLSLFGTQADTTAPTVTTVAIATTVPTTVPTTAPTTAPTTVPTTVATSTSIDRLRSLGGFSALAPLSTTTIAPEIIRSVSAEGPITISSEVRRVTIPVSAIQTLFNSISPKDIDATLVSMRASDGKWKTVRAVDVKDTNIELTDKSGRIEIQLIIKGKDPIIYNVTLNRIALSSSDNSNLLVLVAIGALSLLIGWSFLVRKLRRRNG